MAQVSQTIINPDTTSDTTSSTLKPKMNDSATNHNDSTQSAMGNKNINTIISEDLEALQKQSTKKDSDPTNPPTFKTIVKEGSTWSLIRVIGTSLTAITMALLSTKFGGFVSSFVLVGLVSVGSAIVSEIYRIILSFTSLSAKKVIAPVLKIEQPNAITGQMEIVEVVKVDKKTPEEQEKAAQFAALPTWKKITQHLWQNNIIRMTILFAVVGTLTVTTSYFVSANSADKVETTYTTINNPSQKISETEKNEIANNAAVKNATVIANIELEIEKLKEENAELLSKLESSIQDNSDLKDNYDSLMEELSALKTLVEQNKIEQDNINNTPNPDPEPTPPVESPEPTETLDTPAPKNT